MARVTIGIPVYNGERYLHEALDSVLAQTFTDTEIIISDNASTDRTASICDAFASRDPRIRVLRVGTNAGAAANYNLLVASATSRLFTWHPHDDVLMPQYLERCLAYLDRHPHVVLCYPSTRVIDENSMPVDADASDALVVDGPSPSVRLRQYFATSLANRACNAVLGVIRTDILRKTRLIGPYPGSDKILLSELALLGPFKQLPDVLFCRRYHIGSSLRANPGVQERYRWFDTGAGESESTIQWKWLFENIRAVGRADIPVTEKVRSASAIQYYYRLYRHRLKGELKRKILPRR
jgi:glycosyltransferase involved in cell wall biosynthesis